MDPINPWLDPVEVRAQAHVIDARNVDGVIDVVEQRVKGAEHLVRSPVRPQEALHKRDPHHAATLGQRTELLVGQVSGVVAERPAAAMGGDDRAQVAER